MLTDLRYALGQLEMALRCKQSMGACDAVIRAKNAIERCIEAASRPADAELEAHPWPSVEWTRAEILAWEVSSLAVIKG